MKNLFQHRYYQREAYDAVFREWETHRSTAVVAATGTGKTELYLSIATDFPGRTLVLVHRDYLITSPIERLAKVGFTDVSIEKAELRSETGPEEYRGQIVFASVQSIGPERQDKRLKTFDPASFDLLIIDEGHRAVSPIYRKVIDHFSINPRLKILVLTATPKRKDGIALGKVVDSVAYEYSPRQASEEGWIVPLQFFRREVPNLDFSHVKLKGGDLDPDQLNELLIQEGPLHEVCSSLAMDTGPTIVFCPKVAVAKAYAAMMNERYRPERAIALDANSDDEERERGVKGLADGSLDYVFQVDLFTEGFDLPHLVRVVWAAPTASLVKWTQGCGRVFRVHHSVSKHLTGDRDHAEQRRLMIDQSPKQFGQIITYYPQNCQHAICTPTDILGGKELSEPVRRAAKDVEEMTAKTEAGSQPITDIDTAETIVDLAAIVDQRRKEIKAKATVQDTEFNGLGGGAKTRGAAKTPKEHHDAAMSAASSWSSLKFAEPATPKQIGWLVYQGLREAPRMGITKFRAMKIRDLVDNGVNIHTAAGYGFRQAMSVLDTYKNREAS